MSARLITPRKRWEYKNLIQTDPSTDAMDRDMDAMGKEGWELTWMTIINNGAAALVTYKRELPTLLETRQ